MLAALLGALWLFTAVPAQAQTTLLSATLNVKEFEIGDGSKGHGCWNGPDLSFSCSNTKTLSDDDFAYGGTDYAITGILSKPGLVVIQFDKAVPQGLRTATLNIGSFALTLSNPTTVFSGDGRLVSWMSGSYPQLTLGSAISVSLVSPSTVSLSASRNPVTEDSPATVSLSASPNPVLEGSSVTVTATLSRELSNNVTIPLTITDNRAESGDHSTLTSITIAANMMTGTGTITTNEDTDNDHETFTVALGSLPSSVTAGSPSSVTVTIRDDDGGGGSGGEGTPGGLPGSSGPPGALAPPAGSSGSGGGVGASGGPSGPPAGGGGGGGGGLPPSGSSDEPPPEDDEISTLCSQEDRETLGNFYETTGGEQWDENENWNSEEPLNQWYGVETDEDGNVVSLRLSHNALSGDMPARELLCFSELKELALWGNDLSGEVPEELVLAVERAVLRDIAEMLKINPEWFENYGDPYDFEDWHAGVTTNEEGRVTELDLTGEVPGTLISQLRKLRVITTTSENGGCALSPKDDSSAFSLFLLTLLVFAALGRKRAR